MSGKEEKEICLGDSCLWDSSGDTRLQESEVVDSGGPTTMDTAPVSENLFLISRGQLISGQKNDTALFPLFDTAVSGKRIESLSMGYFVHEGLLMRKWMPLSISAADDWSVVMQIVIPSPYRAEILNMAHDNPLAGHLGVRKTYDRILRHFFWPGLKRDVSRYCRSCHMCQLAGKPNQTVPAPLYPVPVVCDLFERVLVDCVGPLPRTKAGNKFLLTVMCVSTQFPEVFPLCRITTPVIVRALTKFFSLFGLLKVVQTDQGSNFMSRVFAQVLKQLNIKHCNSRAYHPESQGALQRFHQTLKTMLRTYCLEFDKDWRSWCLFTLFMVP